MIRTLLPPRRSLQRRLGLGLAAGVTLLWLAGAVAAGLILRHEIDEVFDSALQEVTQRILPLAWLEVLNGEPGPAQLLPSVRPHHEYITYIVRDGEGRVLLQSHDADPAVFPPGLEPGFHETPRLRLYTEGAVQGTLFVTAAEEPWHRREAVLHALRMLLWPLAVLLPLSQIGVWLLVRVSLRPVLAFQADIEARGRGNLSPVPITALPTEIGPAAAAVNGLILRLRRALEAERSFTANSAHELRTPIAATLAQTQRLIAEVPEGPMRDRARAIEAALRQLSRLSEKLLQLAKADGGGLLAEAPQDLTAVLRFVLDDFAADRPRLRVTLPPRGGFLSRLDGDAFAILARNLIENALKHGAPGEAVAVTLGDDGVLRVTNAGPAIPPGVMARLTRPFERGVTEAGGSGLGLAIAEAIARGAGLRLELLSPIPGRADGFEARLHLPPG